MAENLLPFQGEDPLGTFEQIPRLPLGWCIVELMGHRRLGGYVQEIEVAGAGFLRVDVHEPAKGDEKATCIATQIFAPGAVYAITPTTEEIARHVASISRPEPVSPWELPQLRRGDADHHDDLEDDLG